MIKTDILIIGAGPTGLFAVLKQVIKVKMPYIRCIATSRRSAFRAISQKPIYDPRFQRF
jgi:succinate dehydrogenase/fumarate reductase flavoprotein subunit